MSINEAHQKLGHINYAVMQHMSKVKLVEGIELDLELQPEFCDACTKAKSNVQPFLKESETRSDVYGEYVHWDLWGPALVRRLEGNSYCTAMIDDTSSEEQLYFQQKKSQEIQSHLKDETYLKNQTGKCIGTICVDQGGEFMLKELKEHQDMKGTHHQLTVHDSPSQNGQSERGMHTRAERA
jgi:hypothetical protein